MPDVFDGTSAKPRADHFTGGRSWPQPGQVPSRWRVPVQPHMRRPAAACVSRSALSPVALTGVGAQVALRTADMSRRVRAALQSVAGVSPSPTSWMAPRSVRPRRGGVRVPWAIRIIATALVVGSISVSAADEARARRRARLILMCALLPLGPRGRYQCGKGEDGRVSADGRRLGDEGMRRARQASTPTV